MSRGLHASPARRPGLWLGVAAAVLVAMVLASALHTQPDDPGPDTIPPPAATTPAGIGDPPVPSGRQSPLSGDVVVSGEDVTWHRLCGIDLPFSARYGPHRRDGERASGFGNQPTGAVLAALHLAVRVSPQLGPDVFVPTLAEQVTGPDAAVLAHQVHAQYQQLQQRAQARYGQPVCPIYGRFAGFLLDSHTSTAASLRLLIEAPGPGGGRSWPPYWCSCPGLTATGGWSPHPVVTGQGYAPCCPPRPPATTSRCRRGGEPAPCA